MPEVATRSDALRLKLSALPTLQPDSNPNAHGLSRLGMCGDMPRAYTPRQSLATEGPDIDQLDVVGSVPGVVVLAACGANGPGLGRLRSNAGGRLEFKAPGAGAFGPVVSCGSDGFYLLESTDPAKFLRVQVYASYLSATPAESALQLRDRYNNGIAYDDVSDSRAAGGHTDHYTIELHNVSRTTLYNVRVWVDPSVSGLAIGTTPLELSRLGPSGVLPRPAAAPPVHNSRVAALLWPALAPDKFHTLYLRRSTPAGSPSAAQVLSHLHTAFQAWF